MPQSQEYREPKTWEYIGAVLGYFGIAQDVPAVLRNLGIGHFTPLCIKRQLLEWHSNPDRWYTWAFTLTLILILFTLVWKSYPPRPVKEKDNIEEAKKYLRRSHIIRVIRSFGIVSLREWIMEKMGISLYWTFKRPSEWSTNPKVFKFMDRINFYGGPGLQYEYSKNFNTLIVRQHPEDSDIYGEPTERKPTIQDIKHMIVASWFFPFWFIVHIFKRPFLA